MKKFIKNSQASAGLFISVLLLLCVFFAIDYVIYENDSRLDLTIFEKYAPYMNETMKDNWLSWSYDQRNENFTNYHGGEHWTIFGNPFDDYVDWIGIGYEFTDGFKIHANDYGELLNFDSDNVDYNSIFYAIIKLVFADFEFFNTLGFLGYLIRIILVGCFMYAVVDLLWLG